MTDALEADQFAPSLAERLFVKALALASRTDGPTPEGVLALGQLADGDRSAIEDALAEMERLRRLGRVGEVARELLRSSLDMTGAEESQNTV